MNSRSRASAGKTGIKNKIVIKTTLAIVCRRKGEKIKRAGGEKHRSNAPQDIATCPPAHSKGQRDTTQYDKNEERRGRR